MTSAQVGEFLFTASTSTDGFVESLYSIITDNFGVVLTFTAGIIVWFIAKKWIFGGARKV